MVLKALAPRNDSTHGVYTGEGRLGGGTAWELSPNTDADSGGEAY